MKQDPCLVCKKYHDGPHFPNRREKYGRILENYRVYPTGFVSGLSYGSRDEFVK